MIVFCGAVLLVGAVIALSKVFGLFSTARQAVRTSRCTLDVMRNPEFGDERKEALLQEYSLALLKAFLDLLLRSIGAIAIPVALLWALEAVGVLSLQAILDLTFSWPFLLGSVIAATAAFWFLEK